MYNDPYTLIIAPNSFGQAQGTLYLDDEITLAHERGEFLHRTFTYKRDGAKARLSCEATKRFVAVLQATARKFQPTNWVERVVIADVKDAPVRIVLQQTGGASQQTELTFIHDLAQQTLTIKKPAALVKDDWEVIVEF